MVSLSAIMPVYNGREFIERSLRPLIAMLQKGELIQVIVVDDGSTDGSAEMAARMGAEVVASGGRLGPGGARNRAALSARGEVLWFIDADVVAHDDAAHEIQTAFAQTQAAAVFGSYDDSPSATNFLSQYKNLVHHYYHHRGLRDASTFWAGCGAVARREFFEVGGFDVVNYKRPSIEDIELGYRLRQAGALIVLWPELQGTHLKVWRFFNLLHTEIFCRALPWSRLMLAKTGVSDDLNVGRAERIRALVAGLFILSAVLAWLPSISWHVIAVTFGIAVGLNTRLFALFYQRRGIVFALAGMLFHQFYYVYSGAAFVYCWLERHVKKVRWSFS